MQCLTLMQLRICCKRQVRPKVQQLALDAKFYQLVERASKKRAVITHPVEPVIALPAENRHPSRSLLNSRSPPSAQLNED
jgi:hypothetical protein